MGRKSKLTPELQARLILELSNGSSVQSACQTVDIDPDTYFNWLKWGKAQSSGIYFGFFRAIEKVKADEEAWHLRNIKEHSKHTWTASAWYLERSNPDRWALRRPEEADRRILDEDKAPPINAIKAILMQLVEDHPEFQPELSQRLEALSP